MATREEIVEAISKDLVSRGYVVITSGRLFVKHRETAPPIKLSVQINDNTSVRSMRNMGDWRHGKPEDLQIFYDKHLRPYVENGFTNRIAYLESLCEEYPRDVVFTLADLLGSSEDFDGLITSLEDSQ